MRPVYHPRLVNGAFGDPALYVPLTFRRQALLFDLGDLSPLSPRDLLKLSQIFISHTHIDHFIGFDQVLRLLLGRPKTLHIYGPPGLLANIGGKLSGYTWNLVDNYAEALTILGTEIGVGGTTTKTFDCRSGFTPSPATVQLGGGNDVFRCPEFVVTATLLDHRTPCLGYRLQERFHINIMKARLDALGLKVGPWLTEFKRYLYTDADPQILLEIPTSAGPDPTRTVRLDRLTSEIARITPGQKTVYITDVVYSADNEDKIVDLARGADHLFIEAVFLDSERDIARAKCHLTARQAGTLARKAGARQLTIFHHSPRYLGQAKLLEQEAQQAFRTN